MHKDEYIAFCAALDGARIDYPFALDRSPFIAATCVARHAGSGKWFAAVMEREGRAFVNLKCDPARADLLRTLYQGVTPAYHMNKWHWNSVFLQSDVPDGLLQNLTLESFGLTGGKKK